MYREAIDIAPTFAAAHKEIAYSYLMMPFKERMSFNESIAAAEPYIQRALELAPDSADVIATLALSRSLARDFEKSNRYFTQAISLNPSLFGAQLHYGLSLVFQGRLKEASTAYLRAQALDPLNVTLNFNLGALLMLMGQLDDGIKFSEKALEIDSTFAAARNHMPSWLSNYGRLADAVIYGNDLLNQPQKNSNVLSSMTGTYVLLGEVDEAEQLLGQLLQTNSDDLLKGITSEYFLVGTGDVEGYVAFAEEMFQNVEASPGDRLSFTDRMRAQWYGRSLLLQGRIEEAADMFWWSAGGETGIAAITYDYVFFLKYLALAFIELGRNNEAEVLLIQAHTLVTTARDNGWSTPFLYVRLAEIEAIQGDVQSAVQHIGMAVDKGYLDLIWLSHSPFFSDIQDDPEMRRLKDVVRTGIAAERAKLNL